MRSSPLPFPAASGPILVVTRLGEGKLRFNELRRELSGISQKTLTSTLRSLERDGSSSAPCSRRFRRGSSTN